MINMILETIRKWLRRLGKDRRTAGTRQQKGENPWPTRERQRIVEGVRRFFDENYELRYNVMKQTEEFRPRRQQEPVSCQQEPVNFQKQADNFGKEADNFQKQPVNSGKEPPAGQGIPPWKPLTDRELRRMAIGRLCSIPHK